MKGRAEPDALRHAKRLFQQSFVEGLKLADAFAKARHGIWSKALWHKQCDRGRGHDCTRDLAAEHHRAKETNLVRVEGHSERSNWIEREYPSEAFWLHQKHSGRDDPAGGMGRQVAERNPQRIERGQHIERVLLH